MCGLTVVHMAAPFKFSPFSCPAHAPPGPLTPSGPPGLGTLGPGHRHEAPETGSHLKLRCRVTGGNPSPLVEWFHDGAKIRTQDNFRTRIRDKKLEKLLKLWQNYDFSKLYKIFYHNRKRSTLRIRDLRISDSGKYSCR